MLIFHAVQKLLNTSGISAVSYISKPADEQQMHSWYAGLFSSSFPGKLMVMYVHEPSLLTIVCRGKTIKRTWPQFQQRLPALLHRYHFPSSFIAREMKEANNFVVAKTNSRSMLAYMNQMIFQLEYDCRRFDNYENIELDFLEDVLMGYLYGVSGKQGRYTTPKQYWKLKE